jgi:hypothetical protein
VNGDAKALVSDVESYYRETLVAGAPVRIDTNQ